MTETQIRRSLNDLRNQVKELRTQVNRLMNYDPKRVKEIIDTVEKAYNLEPGTVLTHTRKGRVPEARSVCIVIIRKSLKINLQKTADIFSLHHSTVIHSVINVTNQYNLYNGFRTKFIGICDQLGIVVKL